MPKGRNVFALLMILNCMFLVSCSSDNQLQKVDVEQENNGYEQDSETYCGRGEYVTYNKRDITFGEIKGNPSIYFTDRETEQDIIYTNSECYAYMM
jgi:hypothetical protein